MTAADIADWLATELARTLGVDLFDTALPDDVDEALVVRDYAGAPPAFEHNQQAPVLNYPRVQIEARNPSVANAYIDAESAYATLNTLRNVDINGKRYSAQALQYPFWLRQDGQNRHYVVFNVALTVAG